MDTSGEIIVLGKWRRTKLYTNVWQTKKTAKKNTNEHTPVGCYCATTRKNTTTMFNARHRHWINVLLKMCAARNEAIFCRPDCVALHGLVLWLWQKCRYCTDEAQARAQRRHSNEKSEKTREKHDFYEINIEIFTVFQRNEWIWIAWALFNQKKLSLR